MPILLWHRRVQHSIKITDPFTKRANYSPHSIIIPTRRMASLSTMSENSGTDQQQQNESEQPKRPSQQTKQKKPPLTHFLCLPLISETSLPLLEKTLAKFKNNIPLRRKAPDDHPMKPRPPLFPDSAVRPLGTLHLTLGVMSLTSPERAEEAVAFLQSLDVDKIMQEVESDLANDKDHKETENSTTTATTTHNQNPMSVSLESLDSLPRAKAATVLYAKPVDPTSRLHPFSVRLRNEFVNAGFIEQDVIKQRPKKHKDKKNQPAEGKLPEENINSNENANENDVGKTVAAESEEERLLQRKPKFRPLLLHATLVNTIYARRGPNPHHHSSGARKGRRHAGPLTFDSRDMLAHYRDFYTDDTCMQERELPVDNTSETDDDDSTSLSSDEEAHPSKTVHQLPHKQEEHSSPQSIPKYPFVWASNVPIERLCICEMGAKKPNEDSGPLAARLGQEYRVIAEKRLL